MSKEPRLVIVYRKNKIEKPVWWFQKIETGWSFGPYYRKPINVIKKDIHASHHSDGNYYFHQYDKTTKSKAVDEYEKKEIHRLHSFNTIPKIDGETIWPDGKKPRSKDLVYYIDTDEFEKENKRIHVTVYLVKPSKINLLYEELQNNKSEPKIKIFKQFSPWLVICVSKQ